MDKRWKAGLKPIVVWVAVVAYIILYCAVMSRAAQVDLSWDANAPADEVIRYKISMGKYSGNTRVMPMKSYSTSVYAPATTVSIYNVSQLERWFFRVTAINATAESGYSNMVKVNFPKAPSSSRIQKIILQ